jgi:hypothetical protein
LFLLDRGDRPDVPLVPGDVREFAGWNAAGDQMAFVAAEPLPGIAGERFALLFVPNSNARSAIHVADRDGKNPRRLFSGLRATFLRWAPKDEKLSVWLTFEPTFRSWATVSREFGMWSFDPAAMLDSKTGKLEWMPVRGFEQAELGHNHLMRGEHEIASKWYETALQDMSAEEKKQLIAFQLVHAMGKNHQRNPETERLAQVFSIVPPRAQPVEEQLMTQLLQPLPSNENKQPNPGFQAKFRRDSQLAEVFLGLGDVEGGTAWFSGATADADALLSSRLMLSQFLLLRERWNEYANCVCNEILPKWAASEREVMLAALPLGDPHLLVKLSEERVVAIKNSLVDLRDKAKGDDDKLLIDLILKEVGKHLKEAKLVEVVDKRLPLRQANDGRGNGDLASIIEQVRMNRKILDGDWRARMIDGAD